MAPQQSQALTVTSTGGVLRVIGSECHVCSAYDPRVIQPGASLPQFEKFTAIWDTGATSSVINDNVVQRCGLKPTGMVQVHGVHGAAVAETYFVNFRLPNGVMIHSVHVTRGAISGADALIGMDIITLGDFAITNMSGNTVFSFRTPSQARVDYVQEYKDSAARAAKKASGPGGYSGGKHNRGRRHGGR